MVRDELVKVKDRSQEARLWHLGHWMIDREDRGQESLGGMSLIASGQCH